MAHSWVFRSPPSPYQRGNNESLVTRFKEAVDDDFNFAGGLAVLFEIAKKLAKEGHIFVHQGKTETPANELESQWRILIELAGVLGFVVEPEEDHNGVGDGLTDEEIKALIQQRSVARKSKNWAESDRIRDELQDKGITLIDKPGGVTIWNRG